MRLSQFLNFYPQLRWGQRPNAEVTGLTADSRQVRPGVVFVAIRGHQSDGHSYLPEVCRDGAVALVVEDLGKVPKEYSGAVVEVPNTRVALEQLAARYHGQPGDSLFCVGVTGTNGKTSTTYMIETVLNHFGWPTGVMGTVNHHLGQHVWESQLTTPDPLTLHQRLAEFRALGARAAAFEVSSHALDQGRANSIPFDVAVFTNLSRDHLDYHGTMEAYFEAKQKLFAQLLAQSAKRKCWAIVNRDDSWGQKLHVADRAKVWTYGSREADFVFQVQEQSFAGSRAFMQTPRGKIDLILQIPGLHNIYNATAALAVGLAAGCSLEGCAEALSSFRGVPGRLERVVNSKALNVFVDYAHTDDALRSVLSSLGEIRKSSKSTSRIITVFGCGGDRDKGKRPLMARAAVAGSDVVFITSDNPRSEDPQQIIQDCLAGVDGRLLNDRVFTEVDRRLAIGRALQSGKDGDVILIAGKGHESYQIIGKEKKPFSDLVVAKEWLE